MEDIVFDSVQELRDSEIEFKIGQRIIIKSVYKVVEDDDGDCSDCIFSHECPIWIKCAGSERTDGNTIKIIEE